MSHDFPMILPTSQPLFVNLLQRDAPREVHIQRAPGPRDVTQKASGADLGPNMAEPWFGVMIKLVLHGDSIMIHVVIRYQTTSRML